jgi:hypothetical protein
VSLEYVSLVHRDIFWSIVEAIFKNIGGNKFDIKETTIRSFSPICFQLNRGEMANTIPVHSISSKNHVKKLQKPSRGS